MLLLLAGVVCQMKVSVSDSLIGFQILILMTTQGCVPEGGKNGSFSVNHLLSVYSVSQWERFLAECEHAWVFRINV